MLDLADMMLSPLLLLGTLVAALLLVTKLQTGLGGAASKLSVRPQTQFSDLIGSVHVGKVELAARLEQALHACHDGTIV